MRWKEFSSLINENRCSFVTSSSGKVAELLANRGVAYQLACDSHEWYPAGLNNNDCLGGFRYVDMNHSFFGEDSVLVSEASCCIIIVLLDRDSHLKFCAHVSAVNDKRYNLWRLMKFDLQSFYRRINKDISRPLLFLFSNNLYWCEAGSHEHRNLLKLFSWVFSDRELNGLASSTFLIEGEAGSVWNPYCSVRVCCSNAQHAMEVSFAMCN